MQLAEPKRFANRQFAGDLQALLLSFVVMYLPAKTIGFLLAICGNTLIACSLTLQKAAHNALAASSSRHRSQPQDELPLVSSSMASAGTAVACSSSPTPHPSSANNPPFRLSDRDDLYEDSSNSTHVDLHADSSRHMTSTGERRTTDALAFLRSPTWWSGTMLMAAGEAGNFAAFAFAPASLVAPLGAWSVVLAALLARAFLGETTTRRNVSGIVLCVCGALAIGTAGPDVEGALSDLDADTVSALLVRPPFVAFIVCILSATAALVAVAHFTTLGEEYIFVYIGVSSLLGGVTVVCAKALSTFLRLTIEGHSQFGNWLPLALAISLALAIVAQLRYLNLAMARFGNSQVVPVYYVMFTICAMTSGVIMYREFDSLELTNIPFFFGIAATMSGVFLVARDSSSTDKFMQLAQDDDAFAKNAFQDVTSEHDWRNVVQGACSLPTSPRHTWRGST